MNLTRGILISIEGIDGSGKSTLARSLHHTLSAQGVENLLTKEPGGSQLGRYLRTLLQEKTVPVCPTAEFLLFAADRAQHFHDVIVPNLCQNKLVISDRMADSSVVYQGYGRGLDIEMITSVNTWAMKGIKPDLTLYVQLPLTVAYERIKQRNEKLTSFEQEKQSFMERLIKGFDKLLKDKEHVILLDGTLDPQQLVEKASAQIISWLKKNNILIQ